MKITQNKLLENSTGKIIASSSQIVKLLLGNAFKGPMFLNHLLSSIVNFNFDNLFNMSRKTKILICNTHLPCSRMLCLNIF